MLTTRKSSNDEKRVAGYIIDFSSALLQYETQSCTSLALPNTGGAYYTYESVPGQRNAPWDLVSYD